MNLGGNELLIIGVVALLIFGPSQLPKLFKGLGQSIREMKLAAKELIPGEDEPVKKDETKKGP
jgi:sec-independent protein translocase protein TatA